MTMKKDLDEESSRADGEEWFKEGGCPESSNVSKWSAKNFGRNELNLANFLRGQN